MQNWKVTEYVQQVTLPIGMSVEEEEISPYYLKYLNSLFSASKKY